ncbi:endomucin [Lepus europaeus]|uniref:endomucin n=1 Tax=Lepus europaeus TaxID=9983 RepID=UPI002B4591BB|nr:endomucin [Lepus europaeus]
MALLQGTLLVLLLSGLGGGQDNTAVINTATPRVASSNPATQISVSTPDTTLAPNLEKSTLGTSPQGTTNSESAKTTVMSTAPSLTTVKGEGTTSNGVTKNESVTANDTVTNLPPISAVSTLQSSQHKTENQSSSKTTEIVNTSQPHGPFSETNTLPSAAITTPAIILQSQGTEDGKNMSSSSTNPSYSSVILPVVIALIVVTLSVFVLVGLYRMCWKSDPGAPENGNDQPQSDKESVKLLTVKTISHESGEHSAQGKAKN